MLFDLWQEPKIYNETLACQSYPDIEVRKTAVSWMESFSHDEVVDYLPQLIQALKNETFETSALAEFLLKRALLSPRVAHYLFWLLIQLLPAQTLQVKTPNTWNLIRILLKIIQIKNLLENFVSQK